MRPMVVIGDALLDRDLEGRAERLSPEAPVPVVAGAESRARPGGAALAAAVAAADDRPVVLITALADDAPGRELLGLLADGGVEVVNLGCRSATAEKVRIRAGGHCIVRLDHGGDGTTGIGPASDAAVAVLSDAAAVLVADYGRGLTEQADVRAALGGAARRRPVVWDPHPRGAEPVPGVRVVSPNENEAARLVPDVDGADLRAITVRAQRLVRHWSTSVAITLGSRGAVFSDGAGPALAVPARPCPAGDPCGAGDRFAATVAARLADGALPSEAVTEAVAAATAFVAAGGAAGFRSSLPTPTSGNPLAAMRARGGTVVATGGCFDLIHTGHLSLLESARRLGDHLVVLLNSDDSVRRLKGPGRPLVPQEERARLLSALTCVDAVEIFDEDTPAATLERLRPDLWVKGGDYRMAPLPEAATVAGWGGQCVVVPYAQGRSTTRLLEEIVRNAMA